MENVPLPLPVNSVVAYPINGATSRPDRYYYVHAILRHSHSPNLLTRVSSLASPHSRLHASSEPEQLRLALVAGLLLLLLNEGLVEALTEDLIRRSLLILVIAHRRGLWEGEMCACGGGILQVDEMSQWAVGVGCMRGAERGVSGCGCGCGVGSWKEATEAGCGNNGNSAWIAAVSCIHMWPACGRPHGLGHGARRTGVYEGSPSSS